MSNKSKARWWHGKKKSQARPMAAIQIEYGSLCARAGELQYKIEMTKAELAEVNREIQKLNNEAFEAGQAARASQSAPKAPEEAAEAKSTPEGA